jgi:hypothetical protein
MTTNVILNTTTFPIRYYNKVTNLNEGQIVSNAYITFDDGVVSDDLLGIMQSGINTLTIQTDGETVYYKTDLNAKITNINESLSDGKVQVQANILF